MRAATLLALSLLVLAAPARAAEADRYADGRAFAGEALERLLQMDEDGVAEPAEVDPDAPQEC